VVPKNIHTPPWMMFEKDPPSNLEFPIFFHTNQNIHDFDESALICKNATHLHVQKNTFFVIG
jgi:hypothetical protein